MHDKQFSRIDVNVDQFVHDSTLMKKIHISLANVLCF